MNQSYLLILNNHYIIVINSFSFHVMIIKIKWGNRLIGDTGNDALVSIDGTDFRIQEPKPFSSKWFSKKFKGPGI